MNVKDLPSLLHVVGSYSYDEEDDGDHLLINEGVGVTNLTNVRSKQSGTQSDQLILDIDPADDDILFQDTIDSELSESEEFARHYAFHRRPREGEQKEDCCPSPTASIPQYTLPDPMLSPGNLYADRRKSLRQTPKGNQRKSLNLQQLLDGDELEELRQKYDDLVVYAGFLSSERDMYKRKLEETILAWNKERAERSPRTSTQDADDKSHDISVVNDNDSVLTDVDKEFLERMELQTQSDLYQAKKNEGFKDQGLQKTIQSCKEIRKSLKQVGNPEVERKQKVVNLRTKHKKPLGVLGLLGLTDDKLQDKRSNLKHIDGESSSGNVEKLKLAVKNAENRLQESLSSLKPVSVVSDCKDDEVAKSSSTTSLENKLQDRRISLNRIENVSPKLGSKLSSKRDVENALQEKLAKLKRVDSHSSNTKESMENSTQQVETTLRDTLSSLKRVDDVGMSKQVTTATKEVEDTLQSTLSKLRRVDIDSSNHKDEDDEIKYVESVLKNRRTSLKPVDVQHRSDENDENTTPSHILQEQSQNTIPAMVG